MPFNSIFAWVMKKRIHQIELFRKYPDEVQEEIFDRFLELGAQTEYGKLHNFQSLSSYNGFREKVPLQDYDDSRGL